MADSPNKRLSVAYAVVGSVFALMMFFSASTKLLMNPGALHIIHDVVGVPVSFFPLLAACEIAGGLGLLVGVFRPKLGVAAGVGLVLYFVGAMVAHIRVGDVAGLKAPITPFIISVVVLTLRELSLRRGPQPQPTR